MSVRKKLESVQALRAFAALYVILLHSHEYILIKLPDAETSWLRHVVISGNSGVDLFFVISGFAMCYNHYDDFERLSPAAFVARRVRRVVPLYWLLTLAVAFALAAAPLLFSVPRPFAFGWLVESLLFLPLTRPLPIVTFGWTLNFEAYFYLCFAAALLLPRRVGLGLLAGWLALGALIGAILAPAHPLAALATSGLLLEFVAGIGVAISWRRLRNRARPAHLLGMALGVAAIALTLDHGRRDDSIERLIAWGIPYALILNGALRLEGWRWPRLLVKLGDASYSLYLVQVLTVPVGTFVAVALFASLPIEALVAGVFLFSTAGGWLCWRAIEMPLGQIVKQWPAALRLARPGA